MATYRCTQCATTRPNQPFVCPECGASNSFEELPEAKAGRTGRRGAAAAATSTPVRLREVQPGQLQRIETGISQFDLVTGGGIVPGSLLLLAGEPGSGKSTLLLSVVNQLLTKGKRALYVTGEESAEQIALRAQRLNLSLEQLEVLATTDLSQVIATLGQERPDVAVIDSVQTIGAGDLDGAVGGPAQVKEVTSRLMQLAKGNGISLILVGHVNKDAAVAGPKTLEHLVDAVFLLEGDRIGLFRMLRASKNRYGSIDEVGLFEMRDDGMQPIDQALPILVSGDTTFGRAICPVLEGSRTLLVEVQALVSRSSFSSPRRVAIGVNEKRVAMLLAVLERYAKIDLSGHDVYVQIGAGLNVNEPAVDAAVCAAIASSYWSQPDSAHAVDPKTIVLGEVRLGGGIGPVRRTLGRLREGARQGFERGVGPQITESGTPALPYRAAGTIAELLDELDVLAPAGAKPVPGANRASAYFAGMRAAQRSAGEE